MQVWPRGRRNEEKQVGLSVVRIEAAARVDSGGGGRKTHVNRYSEDKIGIT